MVGEDDEAAGSRPAPGGGPGSGWGDSDYAVAAEHYTSDARRDAVKRLWEEPASRGLLQATLDRVAPALGGRELRVLDVGCGTGDGLALLRGTDAVRQLPAQGRRLRYVGLDLDEHLLATARELHADQDRVHFVQGDVRDGVPVEDAHLHLSTGVPYSHLTAAELEGALTGILHAAATRPHPVAVVVDVLGRYSVEWTSRWSQQRWSYRMSFFHTAGDAPTADMTTYGGDELRALLRRAAARAGAELATVETADRSVLVGRHSTTGDYAPGLPPYRTLVNALFDPHAVAELADLRFDPALPEAPGPVLAFYDDLARRWNGLLEQGERHQEAAGDRDLVAAVIQPMLAQGLERLERLLQQGLGVGHSLTAVAVTRPAA